MSNLGRRSVKETESNDEHLIIADALPLREIFLAVGSAATLLHATGKEPRC